MSFYINPKITVGLVTYNRPEFLREAVKSILSQTHPEFELIISNDYTDVDVTFESIGVRVDDRIKIVNQKRNLGEIRNMNFLLEIAQGDWFVWLADDDLLHPDFLMSARNAIVNCATGQMVGFYSAYITGASSTGVFRNTQQAVESMYFDACTFLSLYTARKIQMIGCYGVVHTETLRKMGGMPQLGNSFSPYADTSIPIMLVEHGALCWLDKPLIFFRAHAESKSFKSTNFSAFSTAEEDFLIILSRVCKRVGAGMRTDGIIANMVRWFSYNEWNVLHRNMGLSKYAATRSFIEHQVRTNFPRLGLKYRIKHLLFMLYYVGTRFFHEVLSRVR
jgi:glycosyltransferase involved in cell wall biosynthesis